MASSSVSPSPYAGISGTRAVNPPTSGSGISSTVNRCIILSSRDQHFRRVSALPHVMRTGDLQAGFLNQFRHGLFHLPAPERRHQLSGDGIEAIENAPILPDHYQREG